MPKVAETTALNEIVQILLERRQDLVNQLAEIDQTFVKHGIPVPDQKGNTGGGTATARKVGGPKPGRPAGKKTTKKASKKRGRRGGRGSFERSAEESVLAFVEAEGNPSTRQINDAWTAEGRNGKARTP